MSSRGRSRSKTRVSKPVLAPSTERDLASKVQRGIWTAMMAIAAEDYDMALFILKRIKEMMFKEWEEEMNE